MIAGPPDNKMVLLDPATSSRPHVSQRGDEAIDVGIVVPPADRGADEATTGKLTHADPVQPEPLDERGGVVSVGAERDDRRGGRRCDDFDPRSKERSAARGPRGSVLVPPVRPQTECLVETRERRGGPPVGLEAGGARARLEAPVRLVRGLREIPRRGDGEPFRIGDDERAGRVRAAEPLLTRE